MPRMGKPKGLRRVNDPPLLILTSLAEGPKHGYALAQDIGEFAGVQLSPGALYGAIARLEERGLIEALPEVERRRPYRVTAAGSAELAEAMREMRRVVFPWIGNCRTERDLFDTRLRSENQIQ